MYEVGDYVMYGTTGACRITDITEQSLSDEGGEQLYYTLIPVFQQCTIHTPVHNTKVPMRPVISKEEAERLIATIPSIQVQPCHGKVNNNLAQHYMSTIKTYDCESLIELTMSIFAKKQEVEAQKKKFGAVDERFLRQAEDLLFGELSVALGIDRQEVPAYISRQVPQTTGSPWSS